MLIKVKIENIGSRKEKEKIRNLVRHAVFYKKIRIFKNTVYISTNYNSDFEALANILQNNGYRAEIEKSL